MGLWMVRVVTTGQDQAGRWVEQLALPVVGRFVRVPGSRARVVMSVASGQWRRVVEEEGL